MNLNPVQAIEAAAKTLSVDAMTTEQQTALEELEAFRFDVDETQTEEAELEAGCLSCS